MRHDVIFGTWSAAAIPRQPRQLRSSLVSVSLFRRDGGAKKWNARSRSGITPWRFFDEDAMHVTEDHKAVALFDVCLC